MTVQAPAWPKQLARRLAEAHETYSAALAVIEAELAAGQVTHAQAHAAASVASAAYEQACALARVEADTEWHVWVGVNGTWSGRPPYKTSPPWLVRAADADGLRTTIKAKEAGR